MRINDQRGKVQVFINGFDRSHQQHGVAFRIFLLIYLFCRKVLVRAVEQVNHVMELSIPVLGFHHLDLTYRNQAVFCKKCYFQQDKHQFFLVLYASFFYFFLCQVDLVMAYLIPFLNPEIKCRIKFLVKILTDLRHEPLLIMILVKITYCPDQPGKVPHTHDSDPALEFAAYAIRNSHLFPHCILP